ncbi:MAG: shikimate kinase [Prevotellaceae bacterium]|jgi:shikimate kinase|nr:shikimate kinase [Prevotellaceae bacterium]
MNLNKSIKARHLILLGMPASGKSAVGRLLADRLKRPFIDTDAYIEQKASLSVGCIFKEYGEKHFRLLEAMAVDDLASEPPSVIATGGGMPCFGDALKRLKAIGLTLYLEADVDTLFNRIIFSEERPLIANKSEEEVRIYLADTLLRREAFYRQSDLVIDVCGRSKKAIARCVIELLPK